MMVVQCGSQVESMMCGYDYGVDSTNATFSLLRVDILKEPTYPRSRHAASFGLDLRYLSALLSEGIRVEALGVGGNKCIRQGAW